MVEKERISRKILVIILSIMTVLAYMPLSLLANPQGHTAEAKVKKLHLSNGAAVSYGNVGSTGGSKGLTYHHSVTFTAAGESQTVPAFCLQPQVLPPAEGTYVDGKNCEINNLGDKSGSRTGTILYYTYKNPGWPQLKAWLNSYGTKKDKKGKVLFSGSITASDPDQAYAFSHVLCAYAWNYSNPEKAFCTWNGAKAIENGLNSGWKAAVKAAYSKFASDTSQNSVDAGYHFVSGGSSLSDSSVVTATWNDSKKAFVTDTITVRADASAKNADDNKAKILVPNGWTLTYAGKDYTEGAFVPVGKSFTMRTAASSSKPSKVESIATVFDYDPYQLKVPGKQDMGFFATLSRDEESFKVRSSEKPPEPTPTPETTSVSVQKVWSDGTPGASSVTVNLLKNGSIYDSKTLSASGGWSYTWTGLEKGANYSVTEDYVPNYNSSVSGNAESGFSIKNTPKEVPPTPPTVYTYTGHVSLHKVLADGTTPETGAVFRVWMTNRGSYEAAAAAGDSTASYADTLTIGSDGTAVSGRLYEGTYTVEQVSGADGYKLHAPMYVTLTGDIYGQTVTPVTEDGSATIVDTQNRFPVSVLKKDADTGDALGGAQFAVYKDRDCKTPLNFKTSNDDGKAGSNILTTGDDGLATIPDELPKGTVYFKEVKAPAGYSLNPEVTACEIGSGDSASVTVKDTKGPSIHTSAKDKATGTSKGTLSEKDQIVDTVSYENLTPGKEYTLEGTLMDKDTGKAIQQNGKDVTASVKFTPKEANGTQDVTFDLDSSNLPKKTVVVFETLSADGKEVANHKDINDVSQSVTYPAAPVIHTTAKDNQTKSSQGVSEGKSGITDTVSYENLTPGKEYTLEGTLMDKETGKAIQQNGKDVTASVKFTPKSENGTQDVTFDVNNEELAGKTVVVYESLEQDGKEVAKHKDISDTSQTVYYPSVKTNAKGTNTEKNETDKKEITAGKTVTITDTVSYKNLIPGKEYTLEGTLMDKSSKAALKDSDGKDITASTKFTPASSDGEQIITFTFNADKLGGTTTVAFEKLTAEGKEVAVHEDINDEDQTVVIKRREPVIHTTAKDDQTDSHLGILSEKEGITDTVSYENLIPGKEYTLKGTLVDKETGDAIKNDGKEVTAEKTFTPDKETGSVEMKFEADSTEFAGKAIVAFESLEQDGKEVASHKDKGDQDQTITYSSIHTVATANGGDKFIENPDAAKDDAKAEESKDSKSETTDTAKDKAKAEESKDTKSEETSDGKSVTETDKVEITDTVSYTGLVPGKEYTLFGTVMDQGTGKEVESTTSPKTFTPSTADGTVDVTFTVDASVLGKHSLVVYERMFAGKYDKEEDAKNLVAKHEDLGDEAQTIRIVDRVGKIKTTAVDTATKEHVGSYSDKAEITDTVSYENLIPGKEYTMKGTLMDKETGKPLQKDGKDVTAETKFTPEKADGTVELKFTVDSTALSGKTVVAFEDCYLGEKEVGLHENLEDEDQSVHFPSIKTNATDTATKEHIGSYSDKTEVTDVVTYSNLIPGKEYTMKGTLMDKETGKALQKDGKDITAEMKFTPDKADGTVELKFTVDSTALSGKTVVAFEDCYMGDTKIAIHEDINDEDQSVHFPSIKTNAVSGTTKEHVGVSVALNGNNQDTTALTGSAANDAQKKVDEGKTSSIVEKIKDVVTGNSDNKDSKASSTDAKDAKDVKNGSDTTQAPSGSGNTDAAQKTDNASANNQQNTANTSNASDSASSDTQAAVSASETIVDTVTYKNLIPGKEYTMNGTLMDKETGKAIQQNGKDVTASTKFTPTAADGSVDVVFTVDGSALKGKTAVAFENCEYNGIKIAIHEDINDEDQSVHFPSIKTSAKINGESEVSPAKKYTIVDTVSYENLVPGKEYTLKGTLMEQKAGTAATVNGKEITAEAKFTPDKASGTTEVKFEISDAKGELSGKAYVVFEKAYLGKTEIASHEDLNDSAQTVSIKSPEGTTPKVEHHDTPSDSTPSVTSDHPVGGATPSGTSSTPSANVAKTGDASNYIWFGIAAAAAAALIITLIVRKRKKH